MDYFKILDTDREARWSSYRYPMRYRWTPKIDHLVKCRSGYHVFSEIWMSSWMRQLVPPGLYGKQRQYVLWRVEIKGRGRDWGDKRGYKSIRLVEPICFLTRQLVRKFTRDYGHDSKKLREALVRLGRRQKIGLYIDRYGRYHPQTTLPRLAL